MHPAVYDEIFNLQYKISRSALEFIQEQLDKYQIDINYITDYDHSMIIKFGRHCKNLPDIFGDIRIDRINKNFIVCGYCDGYLLPLVGDWEDVVEYLDRLLNI